jgi:hypothetical protein
MERLERFKFSLSPATRANLEAVAAVSGKSVADEIRTRLQRSFEEDAIDPPLRELREALANLAALVRIDCGAEWHSSPSAYTEFAAALMQRLAGYMPPAQDAEASDLQQPTPEMLGKIREQDDRRQHSYPQLEATQQPKPGKPARSAQHIKQEGSDD